MQQRMKNLKCKLSTSMKTIVSKEKKNGQRLVGDVGVEAELGSGQGGEVLHNEEDYYVSWTTTI